MCPDEGLRVPVFIAQAEGLPSTGAERVLTMASYKYEKYVSKNDSAEFDKKHEPGSETYNAGIYRCFSCGDEIGIAKGHKLPPQNHHQHAPGLGKIEWQLLVFAASKK